MKWNSAAKTWGALAGVLALALIFLGNHGFRRLVAHTFQLRNLRSELTFLQQEESRLKDSIAAARKDDRALEWAARKELGYLKRGEIEYRFPPPKLTDK